ncbi:hypothetical protein [Nocardia sp. NPDC052566]|uniref:hypothetical protein n=1 Tax=Nocardia sp. NPDC052566 TaxID=3364330 RepID=UPI0037C748B9
MTTVNWERLPGETVEEFVAALLLLANPRGTIITPSRGDRGVDIRLPTDDGRFDIYQVKRFTRPLTSKQATSIEGSWRRFLDATAPILPVRSWTLVTPWNPSNERLEWLDNLTKGSGLDTVNWLGRTNLDTLAADHPQLIDYYFGDGRTRTEDLMSQALLAGRELPALHGEQLLDAITHRQRALTTLLDTVDPFYHYTFQIRPGHLGDPAEAVADLERATSAGQHTESLVVYANIDHNHVGVMRLYPRCAESYRLRPISTTMVLTPRPGSAAHTTLDRFLTYGAPFDTPVPARITHAEGPAGAAPPLREALVLMGAAANKSQRDLELRIMPAGPAIDLVAVEQTRGVNNQGFRIVGTDRAGAIGIEFLLGAEGRPDQLTLSPHDVGGQPARIALPTLRFVEQLFSGTTVTLAIASGPTLASPWPIEHNEPMVTKAHQWANLAQALVELQQHTYLSLSMPQRLSAPQYDQILTAAQVIRGEIVEGTWTGIDLHLTDPAAVTDPHDEFSVMLITPLTIEYDGQRIPFPQRILTHIPTARFCDPNTISTAQHGDIRRLIPGSDPHATVRLAPSTTSARDESVQTSTPTNQ